jgi:hypothetical protein
MQTTISVVVNLLDIAISAIILSSSNVVGLS